MATKGKPITGKVQPDPNNNRKFKVLKSDQPGPKEVDVDIEIGKSGNYDVERLPLPDASIKFKGKDIRWFSNFAIKQGGNPIDTDYTVTIKNLSSLLGDSQLVVYYGSGEPVAITASGDSFTLKNGDPAPGMAP